jgi:hypothetical protein
VDGKHMKKTSVEVLKTAKAKRRKVSVSLPESLVIRVGDVAATSAMTFSMTTRVLLERGLEHRDTKRKA